MYTCKAVGVQAIYSSPFLHILLVFLFCLSAIDVLSSLHLFDGLGLLVVKPFCLGLVLVCILYIDK